MDGITSNESAARVDCVDCTVVVISVGYLVWWLCRDQNGVNNEVITNKAGDQKKTEDRRGI